MFKFHKKEGGWQWGWQAARWSKTTVQKTQIMIINWLQQAGKPGYIFEKQHSQRNGVGEGEVTVAQPRAKLYVANIQASRASHRHRDWMESRVQRETHTAQDDKHRLGTTWSCQSGHQSAGLHARRTHRFCMQGYFSCYHSSPVFRSPQVSMETWRTLSSTWPGAGRNPTTQISA